mmetsp:Transcript_25921/g.42491  ORF Transcript_25921/g.42491 Transcript_25921/m.42491 type:complete len:167 (+) Transcript_25921:132-632(+)
MMMFKLALSAAALAGFAAAADLGVAASPMKVVVEETNTATASSVLLHEPEDDTSHYENPPCMSDEKAVRIMGIDGTFCSPSCATSPCPTDVPDGVTATPMCALQSPTGDKYCAILCKPSSFLRGAEVNGGECGPMDCVSIPGAAGMGICVYTSEEEQKDEVTTMTF